MWDLREYEEETLDTGLVEYMVVLLPCRREEYETLGSQENSFDITSQLYHFAESTSQSPVHGSLKCFSPDPMEDSHFQPTTI